MVPTYAVSQVYCENLTSFAVSIFPVENGILFVQKCEKVGFRVKFWLLDGIRLSGLWTDRPIH